MSCKGKTEPRQNAGRYPTSIALRFYIWIADTKVCFCALSAARRQRPAMRPGARCPPVPPRPIPPAISRPAAGIFLCRASRSLPAARWRRRHQHRYHQHGDIGARQPFFDGHAHPSPSYVAQLYHVWCRIVKQRLKLILFPPKMKIFCKTLRRRRGTMIPAKFYLNFTPP